MPYPFAITFPESAPEITADSVYDADVTNLDIKDSKEEQRLVFSRIFNGIKVERFLLSIPITIQSRWTSKYPTLRTQPLTQYRILTGTSMLIQNNQ